MTIHEALHTSARQPLLTAGLLILTLQMALIITSFRDERSRRIKALYFLQFAFGFVFFYLPLLDICWDINYPAGEKARSAILAFFGAMPLVTMILIEIVLGLVLVAALWGLVRYRKAHLSFESVKETMDLLPAGIAFARPNGDVVFSNLVMNDLSRTLTGKDLTDLAIFRNVTGLENETQFTLPDSSAVWQLTSKKLELNDQLYIQLTATNITEQAAITRQLKEKNVKLRDIHMRLEIYNRQADRIITQQELLSARMAVHNEVGNVLLESRHYLKEPASFDEEKLLQALKNTNAYLLREYEEDDTARDPLADALEMAEAIGVDVAITGLIPGEDPFRMILAAAVSECASNTVKHANGDQLSVNIRYTDGEMTYTLQNNGQAPTLPIHETGGLASLRTIVEKASGTMQTAVSPVFTLAIHLPKPE